MDRPTCKTCVYWKGHEHNRLPCIDGPGAYFSGTCRRWPKQTSSMTYMPDRNSSREVDVACLAFPEMYPDEWCGEHQDFPVYVEWLRQEKMKGGGA